MSASPGVPTLVIGPDWNDRRLAWRDIIGWRLRPAVRHIEPVNNGEAQRIGSLNNTAAHGREDSAPGAAPENHPHKKDPEV